MKFLVFLAVLGCAAAQKQYVWDLLNPYLNAAEVQALLSTARAGQDYPNYDQIPQTNFDCSSKKQPGFYADTDAKCQVFHRCDINGNQTSYLCVNTTVFNQITLICDYYFNVDCSKAKTFENFANANLYKGADVPLFESPPADYLTPQQKQQQADAEVIAAGGQPAAPAKPSAGKKPAAKPSAGAATTKKPSAGGRNLDNGGSQNQVQPGQNKPAKPSAGGKVTPKAATTTTTTAASEEETTAAGGEETTASGEETTAASSEETSAASGEETTAASGEDTTAASGDDTTAASSDETSASSGDDTTAASSDETTAASGDETSAASGEDTTAAGGEEETTTAAQ